MNAWVLSWFLALGESTRERGTWHGLRMCPCAPVLLAFWFSDGWLHLSVWMEWQEVAGGTAVAGGACRSSRGQRTCRHERTTECRDVLSITGEGGSFGKKKQRREEKGLLCEDEEKKKIIKRKRNKKEKEGRKERKEKLIKFWFSLDLFQG